MPQSQPLKYMLLLQPINSGKYLLLCIHVIGFESLANDLHFLYRLAGFIVNNFKPYLLGNQVHILPSESQVLRCVGVRNENDKNTAQSYVVTYGAVFGSACRNIKHQENL